MPRTNIISGIAALVLAAELSCFAGQTNQAYYGAFKNEKELSEALNFFKVGSVTNGRWKGLKLKNEERNAVRFTDYINTTNSCIQDFKKLFYSHNPSFPNLDNLKKVQIVYDMLRGNFEYEPNPFEKLENLALENNLPEELRERLAETRMSVEKNMRGFQTIEETWKYRSGHCQDLSLLLVSCLRSLGVESYLIVVKPELVSGLDHMVVTFDSGIKNKRDETKIVRENSALGKKENIFCMVDPSYFKTLDFIKNLEFCLNYFKKDVAKGLYVIEKDERPGK
jgi:hypothetical protein